jgi:hypothetical protein
MYKNADWTMTPFAFAMQRWYNEYFINKQPIPLWQAAFPMIQSNATRNANQSKWGLVIIQSRRLLNLASSDV